jgi:Flp pilus assembly protein CpaB
VENLAPSRLLKTRQGTIVVGVAAAVLAAILLLVYLSHYRSSVKGSSEPQTVLVAKRLIPKGTAGSTIAEQNLFVVTTIPKGQLLVGAISDSAALQGTVTATDIYPQHQLTTSDFTTRAVGALAVQLTGGWRAIALPTLDSAHGLSPDVQAGDHVDVYAQHNGITGLVMADVLVLVSPTQATSSAPVSGNYILRIPTSKAAKFAYLGEQAHFWLVLRPANKPRPTAQGLEAGGNLFGGR